LSKFVYIKRHLGGAGKPIYEGYKNAWSSLGYSSVYYDNLSEIDSKEGTYYLMVNDGDVTDESAISKVKNSFKTFLYTQPNEFPDPWGKHPNFSCLCPDPIIKDLNNLENVVTWGFGNTSKFHTKWKKPTYVPLAFDNITYNSMAKKDPKYKFDICFVGGWADNGFDEKRKIMVEHFEELQKLNIKLGISVNQNISTQEEANLLFNSTIAINLHDNHARVLGLDVNERTFKSLGLTGFMICDSVKEVERLFPSVPTAETPKKFADLVKLHLDAFEMDRHDGELENMKSANRKNILDNHTYVHRVKQMLEL